MNKHFSDEADKNRFEYFMDAILAIIITILVLEFKVPEKAFSTDQDIKTYLRELFPSVFSYIISFCTIAVLWMDHHFMLRSIRNSNTIFVLLNFFFILFLSSTPFTTALAGRNHESSFAVALVAINYTLMSLSFFVIWTYAVRKKIITEPVIKSKLAKQDIMLARLGLLLLLASIPLAYLNTYISFGLFILVIILHLIKQIFH